MPPFSFNGGAGTYTPLRGLFGGKFFRSLCVIFISAALSSWVEGVRLSMPAMATRNFDEQTVSRDSEQTSTLSQKTILPVGRNLSVGDISWNYSSILGIPSMSLPQAPPTRYKGLWKVWTRFFASKRKIYCEKSAEPISDDKWGEELVEELSKRKAGMIAEMIGGNADGLSVLYNSWGPLVLILTGICVITAAFFTCCFMCKCCRGGVFRITGVNCCKVRPPVALAHLSRRRQFLLFFVYVIFFCGALTISFAALAAFGYQNSQKLTKSVSRTVCGLTQLAIQIASGSEIEEVQDLPALKKEWGEWISEHKISNTMWQWAGFDSNIAAARQLVIDHQLNRGIRLKLATKTKAIIDSVRKQAASQTSLPLVYFHLLARLAYLADQNGHRSGAGTQSRALLEYIDSEEKVAMEGVEYLVATIERFEKYCAAMHIHGDVFHSELVTTSVRIQSLVYYPASLFPYIERFLDVLSIGVATISWICLLPCTLMVLVILYLCLQYLRASEISLTLASSLAKTAAGFSAVVFLAIAGIASVVAGSVIIGLMIGGDGCRFFKTEILTNKTVLKTLPGVPPQAANVLDCFQYEGAGMVDNKRRYQLAGLVMEFDRITRPISYKAPASLTREKTQLIKHAVFTAGDSVMFPGIARDKQVKDSSIFVGDMQVDEKMVYGLSSFMKYFNGLLKDNKEFCMVKCEAGQVEIIASSPYPANPNDIEDIIAVFAPGGNIGDTDTRVIVDTYLVAVNKAELRAIQDVPCPPILKNAVPSNTCKLEDWGPSSNHMTDGVKKIFESETSSLAYSTSIEELINPLIGELPDYLSTFIETLLVFHSRTGCKFMREQSMKVQTTVCKEILPLLMRLMLQCCALAAMSFVSAILALWVWRYLVGAQMELKSKYYYSPLQRIIESQNVTTGQEEQLNDYAFRIRGGLQHPAELSDPSYQPSVELQKADDTQLWKNVSRRRATKQHRAEDNCLKE